MAEMLKALHQSNWCTVTWWPTMWPITHRSMLMRFKVVNTFHGNFWMTNFSGASPQILDNYACKSLNMPINEQQKLYQSWSTTNQEIKYSAQSYKCSVHRNQIHFANHLVKQCLVLQHFQSYISACNSLCWNLKFLKTFLEHCCRLPETCSILYIQVRNIANFLSVDLISWRIMDHSEWKN